MSAISVTGLNIAHNADFYLKWVLSSNSASNGQGIGLDNVSVTATLAATAPAAPTITGITPGNGQLSVAFTAGSDGGSAITNYQYSTNGGSSFTAVSPAATTSPITITGLTNGTSYNVQIRAVNAIGNGAATANTSATPRTVPGAPTGLSVTPGNGQLTASFTAPASDGGSAITNYEYSTNNGSSFTAVSPASTTTSIIITGLTNGTPYNVQVRAVNAAGSGSATSSVSGTPAVPASPTISPSTASLTGFTATYPSAGTAQSLTVNATNLSPASGTLTINGSTNYEVSTNNSTFGNNATLNYSGSALSSASANVFIRLKANLAAATYNSETIAISGGGATTQNVTVSGSVSSAAPPALTAAGSATVDSPFTVTFSDNATWRGAITSITVGGTTLASGAYSTGTAGQITFTPSASALLQSSGSKSIVVTATNYTNASVSQTINPGAATKLSVTTQPAAPASNGAALGTQPVVTVQDQYNNTVTGSSASITAAVGSGTWTLGGTTPVSASSGVATFTNLTATSAAAVTGATISFTSSSLTSNTSSSFNIPAPVVDYVNLTATGTAATENFDSMNATTTLPTAWKMHASTASPTWSAAGSTVTQQASSGSPNTGGTYNWGSNATERAVGAMTSGGFASPNQLLAKVRNNTGSTMTNLSIDFKVERYRVNTSAASVELYYSTDGTSWTLIPGGNVTTSDLPTGTSAYDFATGLTINRTSITQSGLSIANGSDFYLRWNINTTGSNSQGIGIDDVSITGLGNATMTIGGSSANATAADFTTTYGTASANQTFTIAGSSLQGNITATAGTGFEVSTNGTTYASSVTFTRNATYAASGTLYARLTATAAAATSYLSANVATLTSTNAPTLVISTDGTGSDVTQATPTVSVAPTAGAITYGQTLASSSLTGGSASVAGSFAFTTPSTAPNAGTASQSITFTPTDSGNYTTASTSASVTVNQAALTITGISIANKTYDGTTSATISGTAAYSGLVLGQSLSVTGTGSATFGNATVGTNKPVTITGYTAPNGNYSISQPSLTGNITAASVTVTANATTKTFGASDPALGYTSSPALIAGNSFSGSLTRAAGEGVGTYAISQGTLSAGSNYTISFTGSNLTITQATPTITDEPIASNITSGQALSASDLTGGAAGSVAGSFAFTTPGTVPSPGIYSANVTFTPNDTGNYTVLYTDVNVGVLCVAPVNIVSSKPTSTGFTVSWNATAGASNYTVTHSTSRNMTGATSVDTTSTNMTLTVPTGVRYSQVRANNDAGASANSTISVAQLNMLPAGATTYLSAAGEVSSFTVEGIFGLYNDAMINMAATDDASTNILLLGDDGSTAHTIWYNNAAGKWRAAGGGDTDMKATPIPKGKAFMLRNRSSTDDYFLLSAAPRSGNFTVSVNATAGQVNLLTPATSKPTALNALNLRPTGGNATNTIQTNSSPRSADLILLPQSNGGFVRYYHDGTNWRRGTEIITDPSSVTVPAGGAFFIRKAPGSSFNSYNPPDDE